MWSYISNPAIQLIALLIVSGLILSITVFFIAIAHLVLKSKSKSISEIAADGKRVNAQLERYVGNLSGE